MTVPSAGHVLRDAAGRPVLRYAEQRRGSQPLAEVRAVLDPNAAATVFRSLPGWFVRTADPLAGELLADGGRLIRHAHWMRRDLTADPPPADWACPLLPTGVALTPADRLPGAVYPASLAAFGSDHPDRRHAAFDPAEAEAEFGELLAGRVLGPLTGASALAVDAADEVVGAIVVSLRDEGPWIGTVFRRPGEDLRGLGEAMIRRALAVTVADGGEAIGLAVTEGNRARRIYDRLGFTVVESSLTVWIPDGDPQASPAPNR